VSRTAGYRRYPYQGGSHPAAVVEHRKAVFLRLIQGLAVSGSYFPDQRQRFLILHMAVLVYLSDGGTRQDIVELMAKHDLPCPENPLFIVGDIPKQRSHHGEQLRIPEGILHPPVHFLIV